MEKPKEYKIETFQDMIDCTNVHNLDNFIKDLKGCLISAHLVRDVGGLKDLKSDGFIWIDDGKHKIIAEISTNEAKAE